MHDFLIAVIGGVVAGIVLNVLEKLAIGREALEDDWEWAKKKASKQPK